MLSPSPPTVLPTDNTFCPPPPPPLCPVSSSDLLSLLHPALFPFFFFPRPRFVCARVETVSMESGELTNSSGADVVVEDLLLCACQFQDNAATSLPSTRGSRSRCVYGRGVCESTYPFPSIYSGIQTKKSQDASLYPPFSLCDLFSHHTTTSVRFLSSITHYLKVQNVFPITASARHNALAPSLLFFF